MPEPATSAFPIRQKVEIRFEKRPEIRFVSHLDIARAFERTIRRARIAVRLTQGFNPHPRIIFPVPIEVGAVSLDDVAEMEMAEEMHPSEISARLDRHFPPGLAARGVTPIPCARRARKVRELRYALDLKDVPWRLSWGDVEAFMAAETVMADRRGRRDGTKRGAVNARSAVTDVKLDGSRVLLGLRPIPGLFVRADEVLACIARKKVEELIGVDIIRLRVEMDDAASGEEMEGCGRVDPASRGNGGADISRG